ncbi:MAG: hypothetical protein WCF23_02055 [Candidatus Nitrosopolaris sp.]
MLRENVRRSFREMILVYLIVIFEEFLSNTLTALFMKRREILKSSGKNITDEQALQYTNLDELLDAIGKKEVDSIMGKDIDSLGKYLVDTFHFDVTQRKDWRKFKEFFYRRNIIVHNYGRPNSLYISKTGKNLRKDDWLEIDERYLREAFNIFEKYALEIEGFFHKKYGKRLGLKKM